MRDTPTLDPASAGDARRAYARRTRRGAGLLLLLVGALTALAVVGGVPYAGLAALVLTFGGGTWLARRWVLMLRADAQGEAR
jgi:uncharacterized membrane protein YbhN (UPF0104 family)